MADDKAGRDKQARDARNRQREREIAAELERGAEAEPPVDASDLALLEGELAALTYPATGAEIVATVGDHLVDTAAGPTPLGDLVPETALERFESPTSVRTRVQRPTVAAAMKRVLEAADSVSNAKLGASQADAYEKTFRELVAIDADDDDEGVRAVADWVVDQLEENRTLPESRDVRRQAARFCRTNGYEVRDDEWLGV